MGVRLTEERLTEYRTTEYREALSQRFRRLAVAVGSLFLAVAGGYWYAQVISHSRYQEMSENNRLRPSRLLAPRGIIEDRSALPLVENVPSYNLFYERELDASPEESLAFAAGVLDQPATVLSGRLAEDRSDAVLLAEELDLEQLTRFEAMALEHPAFRIEVVPRRLYRHGTQTAHLLGYLGEVGERELRGADWLVPGDLVGKEGVEQALDADLRGRDGRVVAIVDSRGRVIEQPERIPAQPGQRVRLTVDLELQQEAELQLGGRVGAVIALDPRDGAVRALYSSPSFDPNLFSRRLTQAEWDQLLEAPNDVLQNRVLESAYPPGSIFKIVMALAALGEDAVDADHQIYCRGSVRLYDRTRRCWRRGGHGWVNLEEALKESCDVYFYLAGQELGIERIAAWARRLGLGRETGIDLQGEKPGLVPDEEWSKRQRGHAWYPGETISVAIGQGPILTTPLQIAVLMAAVANGGRLVTPYVVDRGTAPPPQDLRLDPQHLELVRRALWAVVNDHGTAAGVRLAGVDVAGKTGTAQVVEQKTWTRSEDLEFEQRDHAWFASYAPAENAELVVVAFVEHGGHGASVAAPIVKAMYEKYFDLDSAGGLR